MEDLVSREMYPILMLLSDAQAQPVVMHIIPADSMH